MYEKLHQDMNTVDGATIKGGPFDGFKLVAQKALGVGSEMVNVYNSQDRLLGYVHLDVVEEFMEGAGAALRPIENWRDTFSRSLMKKLGLVKDTPQTQDVRSPREEELKSFMVATDDFDSHFRYKVEGMGFLELIDLWEKGVGALHVDLSHPDKYEGEIVVVTARPGFESEFEHLREDLSESIIPELKASGPRMYL
jgi:hypothetical protein